MFGRLTELLSQTPMGTRVIRGDPKEVSKVLMYFGLTAASDAVSPLFCAVADKDSPRLSVGTLEGLKDLQAKYPQYKMKYITDVQKENLNFVRAMIEAGFEIRHIEGMKANFGVSRTQYMSTSRSLEKGLPDELIWSDNPELVEQMANLFTKLWESALPAETRVSEIEQGLLIGPTKLTFDTNEIIDAFDRFVRETEKDAYVIMATEEGLRRNIESFQELSKKCKGRGLVARVLVPSSFLNSSPSLGKMKLDLGLERIDFRTADRLSSNFYLGIYDQKQMITAQFAGDNPRSGQGILYGTITSSRETIAAMLSIFDALWHESDLRDREERSKKKAQLLQDILTHDIRNYNQVARLSAELLNEEIPNNPTVKIVARSMLDAIDGSTRLLERASRLGKVLAEEHPALSPVDCNQIFLRAFEVVKRAYSDKEIVLENRGFTSRLAVADDLLQEVFSNILSNAVKHSNSKKVELEVRSIEREDSPLLEISISDDGPGISDEVKSTLFARYLESAKGSGLGMSIVHALVVERYRGKVEVLDRVAGDHTRGTTVKIWLPKSET